MKLEGERWRRKIISLLEPERNQALRIGLKEVTARLGDGGASLRGRPRILEAVAEWKS